MNSWVLPLLTAPCVSGNSCSMYYVNLDCKTLNFILTTLRYNCYYYNSNQTGLVRMTPWGLPCTKKRSYGTFKKPGDSKSILPFYVAYGRTLTNQEKATDRHTSPKWSNWLSSSWCENRAATQFPITYRIGGAACWLVAARGLTQAERQRSGTGVGWKMPLYGSIPTAGEVE